MAIYDLDRVEWRIDRAHQRAEKHCLAAACKWWAARSDGLDDPEGCTLHRLRDLVERTREWYEYPHGATARDAGDLSAYLGELQQDRCYKGNPYQIKPRPECDATFSPEEVRAEIARLTALLPKVKEQLGQKNLQSYKDEIARLTALLPVSLS